MNEQVDMCSFLKEHNMRGEGLDGHWTLDITNKVNDHWYYKVHGRNIVEIDHNGSITFKTWN